MEFASRRKKKFPPLKSNDIWKALRPDSVRLAWARKKCELFQQLSEEVVREVSCYLADRVLLPCVMARDVRFFDEEKCSWRASLALAQSIKCDEYSSYTLAGPTRLCVVGNGSVFYRSAERHSIGREAYVIHFTQENRVEELQLMQKERYAPGLLWDEGVLYAFGAFNGRISGVAGDSRWAASSYNSGERLRLGEGGWVSLRGLMAARGWFTPCVYRRLAYLCGGYASSVDIFDLLAQTFQASPRVQLPEEVSGTVAFVRGNDLVVISANFTSRVDLLTGSLHSEQHEEVTVRANSSPKLTASHVFWVRVDGRCVRATLELPTKLAVFG